jgi:hypothetical protein
MQVFSLNKLSLIIDCYNLDNNLVKINKNLCLFESDSNIIIKGFNFISISNFNFSKRGLEVQI